MELIPSWTDNRLLKHKIIIFDEALFVSWLNHGDIFITGTFLSLLYFVCLFNHGTIFITSICFLVYSKTQFYQSPRSLAVRILSTFVFILTRYFSQIQLFLEFIISANINLTHILLHFLPSRFYYVTVLC